MISKLEIVSVTHNGMGNRIKSLLSVMRMTEDYRVYWPKNRFGYSSFSDLFKNDIEVKKVPFFKNIFIGQKTIYLALETRLNAYFLVKEQDNIDYDFAPEYYDQKGGFKQINNGRSIDWQYERIPKEIKESYLSQIKKLIPSDYIQNQVDSFYSKSFDKNTVSVQLRTWKDETRRQEMFNKDEYFEYLDKLKGNNFFLSSDDQEIIDEIIARYPGRAFYYPKRTSSYEPGSVDSKSADFMQDNLIDMLLLSKSPLIIGSHLSSFVECAWWFGHCKSRVVVLNQNTIKL